MPDPDRDDSAIRLATIYQERLFRARHECHEMQEHRKRVDTAIGNVLDFWEQIPNDIRTDPGFDGMERSLLELRSVVFEAN